MPFLNSRSSLNLIVACLVGSWCSCVYAQSATTTKRYPASTNQSGQRTSRQVSSEEDDAPAIPPRSSAAGRAKVGSSSAGQTGQTGSRSGTTTGRAAVQQGPAERPVGQAMRIPKVSPEVEAILKEWEDKSSKIKRLEGQFSRTTYNNVFEQQKVATGKYCFEFPDKGSFHQTGLEVAKGTVSKKKTPKGQPYTIKSGDNERWICTGEKIFKLHDDKNADGEKQYEEIDIPEADRGQNIKNAPLPFVFGLKAAEAKQRYQFVLDQANTNQQTIRIKVIPMLQQDIANYSEAEVILDRSNCLPLAVRLTDPTGNSQDVFTFPKEERVVNRSGLFQLFVGDPLKPDLRGYKKLVHKEADDIGAGPRQQQFASPVSADRRIAAPTQGPKPVGSKSQPQKTAELPVEESQAPRKTTQRPRNFD